MVILPVSAHRATARCLFVCFSHQGVNSTADVEDEALKRDLQNESVFLHDLTAPGFFNPQHEGSCIDLLPISPGVSGYLLKSL